MKKMRDEEAPWGTGRLRHPGHAPAHAKTLSDHVTTASLPRIPFRRERQRPGLATTGRVTERDRDSPSSPGLAGGHGQSRWSASGGLGWLPSRPIPGGNRLPLLHSASLQSSTDHHATCGDWAPSRGKEPQPLLCPAPLNHRPLNSPGLNASVSLQGRIEVRARKFPLPPGKQRSGRGWQGARESEHPPPLMSVKASQGLCHPPSPGTGPRPPARWLAPGWTFMRLVACALLYQTLGSFSAHCSHCFSMRPLPGFWTCLKAEFRGPALIEPARRGLCPGPRVHLGITGKALAPVSAPAGRLWA